jgi:hypothetical protein
MEAVVVTLNSTSNTVKRIMVEGGTPFNMEGVPEAGKIAVSSN